ncbi:MAG: hypothetical protein JNK05_39300 [Myxococcales bacterium]|nr:hypothetical protein [Myxococcales bacterium]
MRTPALGWLALMATLGVAACAPTPLPTPDVMGNDTVVVDSRPNDVTNADRPNPPDDVPNPPNDVPNPPDDVPTAMDVPNTTDTPSPSDVTSTDSTPADTMGMDATGADVRTDSGPDASSGCGLTVDGTLAIPAAGMTTTVNTMLAAGGTGGMNNTITCTTATQGGSERVYRLTLTARTGVVLRATATTSGTDLTMVVRRNCASTVGELACNDDTDGTNPVIRTVLDPGEYFVVVDEYGDAASATGGPVTLTLQTYDIVPNADCAMPETLTGMTRMGNTNTGATPMTTCNSFNNGSQLFYSLTIPANTRTRVTATPSGMPAWSPYVRVFSDCASAATCLATASTSAGMPSTAVFDNRSAMARTVIVSVGSTTLTNGGAFSLAAANEALPTPAANGDCSAPEVLTGMTRMGNTNAGAVPMTSCSSFNNGAQLFYSLTIPANSLATITATPTGMPAWAPYVRVIADCATAATCLATGVTSTAGNPTTVLFENRMASARTVIVSVGSTTTTNGGTFSLTGTTAPLPPVPMNATCATAQALSLPAMGIAGTTVGATEQRSTFSCATSTSGGQLVYYSAVVPAGRTARFTVTPGSMTFNPAIRTFAGCMPTLCSDFINNAGAGAAETLMYSNRTMADETVNFAVGSTADRDQGAFTVDAQLLPAAATNTTCATARTITAGVTPSQLQASSTALSTATCESGATGPVLYYSVTVPSMSRATLTARNFSDNADPVLRVRADCPTAACIASNNNGFTGEDESVAWTNMDAAPRTYIVELGSDDAATRGAFDLELSIADATPAYTVTAVPAASCEDLSMGATSLMITGDDSASAVVALPMGFTFPYFADPMNVVTHFSANTNGLAQLHTSATGVSSDEYVNEPLPSTFAPTGTLAVFWDDLNVDTSRPGAAVRYATIGSAPNRRFVIEWNNMRFNAGTTDTMRFQVKLFETAGLIEYHYCSMTTTAMTTRHTGTEATVGLQNVPRSRGQFYLHNGTDTGAMGGMPRSVGGGTAASPSLIRFIPR